jgi:endo-1,3(4)-beta-glucanase
VTAADTFDRQNSSLREDISKLDSGERIQGVAAKLGMVTPAAGDVHYLDGRGADAARAAAAIKPPDPVTPTSTATTTTPVATTAAPATTTTAPAAAAATTTTAPATTNAAPVATTTAPSTTTATPSSAGATPATTAPPATGPPAVAGGASAPQGQG